MKTGVELIAKERERGIKQEGWTPEHDDTHERAQLTCAAIAYAQLEFQMVIHSRPNADWVRTMYWPFEKAWWKPSNNPVCNLIKAGALIAAEIDRLQRISAVRESHEAASKEVRS